MSSMFTPGLVPQLRDFCTPTSTGLRMYYSTTPLALCRKSLTIPACTNSTVKYGPFERRPAGEFQVFTLHRAPLESLIARWKTGDMREMVRQIGTPPAGLSFDEAAAWVAGRPSAQRQALDDFRVELAKEYKVCCVLNATVRYHLVAEPILFSTLAYAAAMALYFEVCDFAYSWSVVENQVARGPVKSSWASLGELVAGVTSKLGSLLALPALLKKGSSLKSYAKAVSSDYSVDGCFVSRLSTRAF